MKTDPIISAEADKLLVAEAGSFLPPPDPKSKGTYVRKGASGWYAIYKDSPGRSVRLGEKIYFGSEGALKRALIRAGFMILTQTEEDPREFGDYRTSEEASRPRMSHWTFPERK